MNSIRSSRNLTLENIYDNKDFEPNKSFSRCNTGQNTSKLRMDKFGNIISKKNSNKYRICFVDQIDKEKKLVEIHRVESYKQYNQNSEKKSIYFSIKTLFFFILLIFNFLKSII